MFDFSIRAKLYIMSGVCAAALVVTGTVGLRAAGAVATALRDCDAASTAQRNQMFADMDHDAIRADVMQALVSENVELSRAAQTDLPGHISDMRKYMEENRSNVTDPAARQAIEAVLPALTDYANSATLIVELARLDRASAIAKLDEFYKTFNVLAERMEQTGDIIAELQARTVKGDNKDNSISTAGTATIWVVSLCGLALMLIQSMWATRSIIGPLRDLAGRFHDIANGDGDLRGRVDATSKDEIGTLARLFNQFLDKMEQALLSVAQDSGKIGESSQNIRQVSDQLAVVAEQTSAQAQIVSSAAEEIRANMTSVSSGASEMESNIRDIGRDASEAKRVADEGVAAAKATDEWVGKMGDRSNEIGEVIKVISSIAEQTNLLALNATIEAARAGEAGKGFAVVANEVKELAKETARATEDIGKKIEAMQRDTRAAVTATAAIAGVIERINERQSTIALAVERQTLLTGAITQNVAEAARGCQDIAENITGVARAARETAEGASRSQTASRDLAELASGLDASLSQFQLGNDNASSARIPRNKGNSRQRQFGDNSRPAYATAAEE